MNNKICEHCSNPFEGRANKRYCSIACKSAVNNNRQLVKTQELVGTNKILRRNRRILADFYKIFQSKPFDKTLLLEQGFQGRYATSIGEGVMSYYEFTLLADKNKSNFFYIIKN